MNISNPQLKAEIFINAPLENVWYMWTNPEHIAKWNTISEKWHTPKAENDLRVGGKLFLRMELKDGSDGFDYECIYDDIVANERISHTGSDNRKTTVIFFATENGVRLTEVFEPENKTALDVQQAFCQSVLNNFKAYVENNKYQP